MRRWLGLMALAWLAGGCGDSGVAVTEGVETSTGVTTEEQPPTSEPPTTEPPTSEPTTTPVTVTDATSEPTTEPPTTTSGTDTTDTTLDTTTTGDTTDTSTGTDTTDTDTTTGVEVVGKSVSETVNSGTVAASTNFRMVFTLGQPTANQGTYNSANFRLQGGLVGANGNPP